MELYLQDVEVSIPGSSRVLFRVSEMSVKSGEPLCVHGPSGQGKTTFLHLLAGLLRPDKGSVRLGGEDFSSLSERERDTKRKRHFGVVFQQHNLLGYLTATENVLLGMPTGVPDRNDRVREALTRMGMEPKDKTHCKWLSQGERQRVAVARVLAAQPQVILADEPTSSLDQLNAAAVLDALLEAAEKATLVVVSHDVRIRERFLRKMDFQGFGAP